MVICAISHKTSPGAAWPIWRNYYYFESDTPPGVDIAKQWANEVAWVEKPFLLNGCVLGLVSFHQADGDAGGGNPLAMAYDGGQFLGMDTRSGQSASAYEFGLRLVAGHATGRSSGYMWRGALSEVDIIRGAGNRVDLKDRVGLNDYLQYTRARTTSLVFGNLCTAIGGGTWPVIGTRPVVSLHVAGVTRLNAGRRAMARHLEAQVSIYAKVYGLVYAFLLLWQPDYELWYLAHDFDFFPADLRLHVLDMIGVGKALAAAVGDWLKDEDPDADGDQTPEPRYLMTKAALNALCTSLEAAAKTAENTANTYAPFTEDGNDYFTDADYHGLFDCANDLKEQVVSFLAYDYTRADQVLAQSKVRGGYVPLHPEQGPSDG